MGQVLRLKLLDSLPLIKPLEVVVPLDYWIITFAKEIKIATKMEHEGFLLGIRKSGNYVLIFLINVYKSGFHMCILYVGTNQVTVGPLCLYQN